MTQQFKILTTAQYMRDAGAKIAVYSRPAEGKTPLLATLPDVLVLAPEKGLSTLVSANVAYIPLDTTVEAVKGIVEWLKVPTNTAAYKSIALDSLTFLTHGLLSDIRAKNPSLKNKMLYYAMLKDEVAPLIETLLAMRKNVVFVFWQGEYYERNVFKYHLPIAAGSAIADYCMHFFDVVLHLASHTMPWIDEATGKQYVNADNTLATYQQKFLQTSQSGSIFARDRTGKLAEFEPADLTHIVNKLSNGA